MVVRREESGDWLRPASEQVLGYLNFSVGAPDAAFLRNLNRLFAWVATCQPARPAWLGLYEHLKSELARLSAASPAFREHEQSAAVLELLFTRFPAAYREHHRDLLFHQSDEVLFNAMSFGRIAEGLLAQGGPWDEHERILRGTLGKLNDFLGHRPLATLHNRRQTEPYSHERVRPVPLYIREVGATTGRFEAIVAQAIEILSKTSKEVMIKADFSLDLLDELAFDPRAYDFGHPVNRRPNYQFGEWDPHLLDLQSRFRRFVIRQVTLDALMNRVETNTELPQYEVEWEAAAVLAGVILMASGTSGSGPDRHDSSVTLAALVSRIAGYRDQFYSGLLAGVKGSHSERLLAEAARTRQPFGGARQHLNRYLARLRAAQLQHVELARLFAEMGYKSASERQAHVIPVARGRMRSEISCRVQLAHFDLDGGRLAEAAARIPDSEDLLHRAIECGAFVDPWNILGFGGQFSIFGTVESSVHDHRVEELVELVEKLMSLYVRIVSEAAAQGRPDLIDPLTKRLQTLATWWDQYASTEVSAVGGVSGREAYDSAIHLADVLGRWKEAGAEAGNMAFWRQHLDRFNSPKSYAMVIESLLQKGDHVAAMALLMQWLSQAEQIPLEQDSFSFYQLAMRWMQGTPIPGASEDVAAEPHVGSSRLFEPHPWSLVQKFFDYLEPNAEEYWQVPGLDQGSRVADLKRPRSAEQGELEGDEEEDEDNPFGAAYEGMTYRDSTKDGVEGEMMEAGSPPADADEWFSRSQWLGGRLRFLSSLFELWRTAIVRHLPSVSRPGETIIIDDDTSEVLHGWFQQARQQQHGLLQLLEAVQNQPLARSLGTNEALLEDDRQRRIQAMVAQDVLTAWLASERSMNAMLIALPPDDAALLAQQADLAPWQLDVVSMHRSALQGHLADVKAVLPNLVDSLRRQPLLYVPLSKGGEPKKVAHAQRLQHILRELLRLLPRLGLYDWTYEIIETAREMERRFPAGPKAVTEFDRLFQIGFQAIVEQLSVSAGAWDENPVPGQTPTDERLVELIQYVTDVLMKQWLQHSHSVRLSVLERIGDDAHWQRLVELIRTYGKELFVTQFVNLGNLRSVLHRGLVAYIESLEESLSREDLPQIFQDLGTKLPRDRTLADLELVMEAVAENYEYYKDYNSTTTQSDSGDNLHMFLDFLRLKASYDRVAWQLKPLALAHEILVRHGKMAAAEGWRSVVTEKTSEAARWHIDRLLMLERAYGMQLPTVGDRVREQFMRPFQLDRIRALVRPAVAEARHRDDTPSLLALEQELAEYTRTPTGSGLDVPQWLITLSNEVRDARQTLHPARFPEPGIEYPLVRPSAEEIQKQFDKWAKEKKP